MRMMYAKIAKPIVSERHKRRKYSNYTPVVTKISDKDYNIVIRASKKRDTNLVENPNEVILKVMIHIAENLKVTFKDVELSPESAELVKTIGTHQFSGRAYFYGIAKWSGKINLVIVEGNSWD